MQYIKFEQLIENLEKFELKVDSEFQIACLKRVKSGGDLLILNDKRQEALIALLAGFVEKIQVPANDDAPRILIVAADNQLCLDIEALWIKISKRTEMIHTLTYETREKVKQRNDLFNGADIVIGTPKRVNELYFQNGININKLKYFLVVDSEKCLKFSSVAHVTRMSESFPKCQKIVMNPTMEKYTERLVDAVLENPMIIE